MPGLIRREKISTAEKKQFLRNHIVDMGDNLRDLSKLAVALREVGLESAATRIEDNVRHLDNGVKHIVFNFLDAKDPRDEQNELRTHRRI